MRIYLLPLILLCSLRVCCQTWQLLPNSPSAPFRHDDIYFTSPDTGWAVNVDGYIYKTTDGGLSWATQLYQPATSFRCVGFANSQKGWAGNLGTGRWSPTTDTMPLYQTTDGGNTWQAVTNISGPLPKGICGLCVVDDSVAYGVGRVEGPCNILKTSDGGASWVSKALDSIAYFVIDAHFFSRDTGVMVGCTGTSNNENIAVYYTTDGAQTWQKTYSSSYNGHGWKVDFPSRRVGYVAIESNQVPSPILATKDGGLSWTSKSFPAAEQGIGFINDSTGWCGFLLNQGRITTDSGNTWANVPFVEHFNRFRKISDTLAYASGKRIWKYTKQTLVGIHELPAQPANLLEQNFPNPFSDKTVIRYNLPHKGKVLLRVYDWVGRPVSTLVDSEQGAGTHEVRFSAANYGNYSFFYTLIFDGLSLTRKMSMIQN